MSKADEAKLQSQCVLWAWNTHPETRGLFFAVENEGARISPKVVREIVSSIIQSVHNPQNVLMCCRKLMSLTESGNIIGGAQAKAMGVVAGVSDTIFLWDGKAYLIEFKTNIGRQSDKQIEWENKVKSNGFEYFLVRSFDVFVSILEAILDPRSFINF